VETRGKTFNKKIKIFKEKQSTEVFTKHLAVKIALFFLWLVVSIFFPIIKSHDRAKNN